MNSRQRASCHDQTAISELRESSDGMFDLIGVTNIDRTDVDAQRGRHRLDDSELANPGGYRSIANNRCSREARRNLLKQLQPFCAQAVFGLHKSGGVPAWSRQTIDEARADRIGDEGKYNRYRPGGLE